MSRSLTHLNVQSLHGLLSATQGVPVFLQRLVVCGSARVVCLDIIISHSTRRQVSAVGDHLSSTFLSVYGIVGCILAFPHRDTAWLFGVQSGD